MTGLRMGVLVLMLVGLGSGIDGLGQAGVAYRYFRAGNGKEAVAEPRAGFALMGGGSDLDGAFQWLCERAGGGDLLVLRATGDDDYNPYLQKICHLNSVATLIVPSRAAAEDPFAAQAIGRASALFIAGGDQANYINFWMGTPVEAALNAAIRRGVPIGGTSAGLAVLGEYGYSAQGDKPDDPNLDGMSALMNPLSPRVTLVKGFLEIPVLRGVITDTHFARRDRMGRLLVFLARLSAPQGKAAVAGGPAIRGIGIEEQAAVLVEPDGAARVIGHGSAYFIDGMAGGLELLPGKPLTEISARTQKVEPGHAFNLKDWRGDAIAYKLSVEAGAIHSTQAGGSVY